MRNIRRYFTEKVAFAKQEKLGNMDAEERSFRLRKIQSTKDLRREIALSSTQQEDILLEKSTLISASHQILLVLCLGNGISALPRLLRGSHVTFLNHRDLSKNRVCFIFPTLAVLEYGVGAFFRPVPCQLCRAKDLSQCLRDISHCCFKALNFTSFLLSQCSRKSSKMASKIPCRWYPHICVIPLLHGDPHLTNGIGQKQWIKSLLSLHHVMLRLHL